ncbi:MAG: hypothetical protein IPM17_17675 [Verrucomicrobia bacterium]|nr:hypothetical protein [Verrucomicrobiota bacterium]
MKTTIQQHFYRAGLVREEIPLRNGHRHGVHRTWHKNGVLASEEPYVNGLLDGICRQWDEAGHLLGKYRMVRGTGIQRAWHDNGQLQMEVSTVRGEFSGRNRIWLRDGTLLSERFYLRGRVVSADEYREAAVKDRTLPRCRGTSAKPLPRNGATEKHIYRVFLESLLEKSKRTDAREWLHKNGGEAAAHSLGRFKREGDAAKFVEQLYHAGAAKVIAPDIYSNKAGDQFADCLLVRLPKEPAKRKAVRRVCEQLRRRDLGAVKPTEDIGEPYVYLYLG